MTVKYKFLPMTSDALQNSQSKLQPAVTEVEEHQAVPPLGVMAFLDLMSSPTHWLTAVNVTGKYLSFETRLDVLAGTCMRT